MGELTKMRKYLYILTIMLTIPRELKQYLMSFPMESVRCEYFD
jgi:hypothetical protein